MTVEPMMMMILVHGYEQDKEFPVLCANPKLHYHVHNISATKAPFRCKFSHESLYTRAQVFCLRTGFFFAEMSYTRDSDCCNQIATEGQDQSMLNYY